MCPRGLFLFLFYATVPFPHGHFVAISCNLEKRADPGSLISTAPCPRKSSLLWKGSSSASRTHPAQCLWPCPAVPSASEHVQLWASGKPGPKNQWHPNGIMPGSNPVWHLYFSGMEGKEGRQRWQWKQPGGRRQGEQGHIYSIFINLPQSSSIFITLFWFPTPGANLCSCISQLLAHGDPALGSCQSLLNTVCLYIQLDEHANGFNLRIWWQFCKTCHTFCFDNLAIVIIVSCLLVFRLGVEEKEAVMSCPCPVSCLGRLVVLFPEMPQGFCSDKPRLPHVLPCQMGIEDTPEGLPRIGGLESKKDCIWIACLITLALNVKCQTSAALTHQHGLQPLLRVRTAAFDRSPEHLQHQKELWHDLRASGSIPTSSFRNTKHTLRSRPTTKMFQK